MFEPKGIQTKQEFYLVLRSIERQFDACAMYASRLTSYTSQAQDDMIDEISGNLSHLIDTVKREIEQADLAQRSGLV